MRQLSIFGGVTALATAGCAQFSTDGGMGVVRSLLLMNIGGTGVQNTELRLIGHYGDVISRFVGHIVHSLHETVRL